jgi:UDP-N-acetylglucosamine 2-epimerase (non-hydrolysing)
VKTVLCIVGTRPEAIKMAPVIRELRQRAADIQCFVCATGQHRHMLDQVLSLFEIRPDFDLNVMQPDQSLTALTARLLSGLEPVVAETKPDWILAQGDTTSVLAAALVAFYANIRFGHVEAGLRTGTLREPFPEEMNRVVADLMAAALFAPTERSSRALLDSGAEPDCIHVTGNTVVDALVSAAALPFSWDETALAAVPLEAPVVLVTAHRRESFGDPIRDICLALRQLAEQKATRDHHFVFPVHLNPQVRRPVYEILGGLPNVHLIEPVDYLTMVHLLKRATLVLTDSGGIQEEAPSFGIPLLVMRDTTERPEGIDAGVASLVGTNRSRIVAAATRLLTDKNAYASLARKTNPYGDGRASQRIADILVHGHLQTPAFTTSSSPSNTLVQV